MDLKAFSGEVLDVLMVEVGCFDQKHFSKITGISKKELGRTDELLLVPIRRHNTGQRFYTIADIRVLCKGDKDLIRLEGILKSCKSRAYNLSTIIGVGGDVDRMDQLQKVASKLNIPQED